MNNKKAQGISINTIIVAIIALVVLVLLIAIFTGKMGSWISGLGESEESAYRCSCTNMADDFEERCGVNSPGPEWSEKPVPSECGDNFNDCMSTCYYKDKESQ